MAEILTCPHCHLRIEEARPDYYVHTLNKQHACLPGQNPPVYVAENPIRVLK